MFFVGAWVLFEGVFSLWVSLKHDLISKVNELSDHGEWVICLSIYWDLKDHVSCLRDTAVV